MEIQELSLSTQDGLRLFARDYRPLNSAKAVVCLLHGLGEHSGRYFHVGEALTKAGLALLAMDLRGHGKSTGPRGHTPSYTHLLDDTANLLEQAAIRYPRLPVFLFGHSFGGSLVVNYVIRRKPAISGAVITGLGINMNPRPPAWKIQLAKVMSKVWPTFPVNTELNRAGLSRDPEVIQKYNQDPLVLSTVTARFGLESLQNNAWALEHAQEFSLPVLFMYGTSDLVVTMDDLHQFIHKVHGDVTVRAWEECYHEIHNEPCKEAVLMEMIAWLHLHIHPATPPTDPISKELGLTL